MEYGIMRSVAADVSNICKPHWRLR